MSFSTKDLHILIKSNKNKKPCK